MLLMIPLGLFGIADGGLSLVANLLLLTLIALWLALVYWTYSDAKRRIEDSMLVSCAVAASLFPFIGTAVYLIVRPPEYLEDIHEREVEIQAAEARLQKETSSLCPYCDYPVERDFLLCPSCLRKLKDSCGNCGKPLDPSWTVCPYCAVELTQEPPPAVTTSSP